MISTSVGIVQTLTVPKPVDSQTYGTSCSPVPLIYTLHLMNNDGQTFSLDYTTDSANLIITLTLITIPTVTSYEVQVSHTNANNAAEYFRSASFYLNFDCGT